jgi:DMSO/TMAO reductase YedYZ molybdopterin-dependent catalytic subunit
MSDASRRRFLKGGLTAAAGLSGLAVAGRMALHRGLIPPDASCLYGAGDTLTYAANRLLVGDTPAREFPRSMISKAPFANPPIPPGESFARLEAGGFADWRLEIGGLVAHPLSLSLSDLRRLPERSQITQLACEEGWSYIAEWTGAALADVLKEAGVRPGARYVAYYSIEPQSWETIDLAEALHPQTLVTWAMNGGDLPAGFGGPLRLRIPRQLGYKSLKFLTRIAVVDSVRGLGQGIGGANPEWGYSWYAGI